MDAAGEIIQLKVRLLGISPMVWRRVLVPSLTSLHELHGVLQVAMGWESIHLYAFDIYGIRPVEALFHRRASQAIPSLSASSLWGSPGPAFS